MADRRSLLSRFWPPSASRRPSTTQTAAAPPPPPPPSTTRRTPQNQSNGPTAPPPPPRVETKTPAPTTSSRGETKTPAPTTPTRTGSRKASSSPDTKEDPKTSSPSRSTTPSPSSSKPSSPSRFSSQSRSSPQPPSSPQSRPTLPSPSRAGSTPKRASKPPSPTHALSPSPKGKNPTSPSKEKTSTSFEEAPILASKGNDPNLALSQQEAEVKEEVKPTHGQTPEETSFRQDNVDAGKHEPRIKPEEEPEEANKDVKEVVQEIKNEANEETKKEANDFVVSEARILEEAENPNEAKQEATNTKEIFSTPLKKTKTSGARDKFARSSSNEEHVPLLKNVRDEMSKFTNKLAAGDRKKGTSDSERAVSVITLAGENRGASMHIESDSSKIERPIPIHRSYKIKPDESSEATAGGEEIIAQGKKSEDERSMEDQATEAYVNNNAQAINNSIVFNSSITEGSPGVHMAVSHLQREARDETKSSHETRRAEVKMSRAEKLTFHPTVRRRCLRGLLMETTTSGDSDPEKPRRHGCRVSCKKEGREKDEDEL